LNVQETTMSPPRALPLRAKLHRALFADAKSALASAMLLCLFVWAAWLLVRWGVVDAVARPDADACRRATGACWGVVAEKHRLVLLGRFPAGERWRPVLAGVLLLGTLASAAHPRLFGRVGLGLMAAGLAAFVVLMAGGVLGLAPVATDLWGGLPLTLFLAVVACFAGVPLGIALALGRRSSLPAVRMMATVYVEAVRGVPLITLLFFGSFVLPLVLPPQWRLDPMLRIGICLTMFCTAYLAEIYRGGLQAVATGQGEAARSLGLTRWQTLTRIVLPQAMRMTIAPTASSFIGALKDTSLVAIVNVYDLTGTLRLAMSDPQWQPFFIEMYIVVSAIYLALGVSIAQYGRYLTRRYALR
jgi:general L-amino acid transport system permease protein